MTSSTNPADNILLFRQIHPDFFLSQTLQARSFKGQNDRERFTEQGKVDTEYFAISVDIQTPFYNPRQSFERYRRNGLRTAGVVGLTIGEVRALGLATEPKPRPENPHHWHIVLPREKNKRKTQVILLELASTRNWLYAPIGVLTIKLPAL